MSSTSSPKARRNIGCIGCGGVILLFFVALAGYSAIRFLIDQNNYNKGHAAYAQADCAVAVSHFDNVVNAWRVIDIGGFPARAEQEKAECVPFQAAVAKHESGDLPVALMAYMDFVRDNSNSALTGAARERGASLFGQTDPSGLASQDSCDRMDILLQEDFVPQQDVNLPPFYLACGQVYDSMNDGQASFEMYKTLLTEYPDSVLASEAESSLMANPQACEASESLRNSAIAERTDFMPSLYVGCGQAYEEIGDWDAAILMYENFLADHPDHALAADVEAALARSIVAQAQALGAGEIPPPARSGSTGSDVTAVIIQNDSPDPLRIVFSGPESRVEELEACDTCTNYTGTGPAFCPELGPIGNYTLLPGEYDVVVESVSDDGTTPWTGSWEMLSGDEYYSCFFVVTTFGP